MQLSKYIPSDLLVQEQTDWLKPRHHMLTSLVVYRRICCTVDQWLWFDVKFKLYWVEGKSIFTANLLCELIIQLSSTRLASDMAAIFCAMYLILLVHHSKSLSWISAIIGPCGLPWVEVDLSWLWCTFDRIGGPLETHTYMLAFKQLRKAKFVISL